MKYWRKDNQMSDSLLQHHLLWEATNARDILQIHGPMDSLTGMCQFELGKGDTSDTIGWYRLSHPRPSLGTVAQNRGGAATMGVACVNAFGGTAGPRICGFAKTGYIIPGCMGHSRAGYAGGDEENKSSSRGIYGIGNNISIPLACGGLGFVLSNERVQHGVRLD